MVFSDLISESMLDVLIVSIKITRLADITGHSTNIQEAAYSPIAAGMTRHRIPVFTYLLAAGEMNKNEAMACNTTMDHGPDVRATHAGTLLEFDMAPFITPDVLLVEQRQRPLKAKNFYGADPGSNWLPL